MNDDAGSGGLHIDSDWKTEAAREKERLTAEEQAAPQPTGTPEASFIELVNLLAMQAAVALGGYQGPGGDRIPANPLAAKHYIDLMDMLEKKTAGNLADEEKRTLDGVIYELRMQYVQASTGGAPPAPKKP